MSLDQFLYSSSAEDLNYPNIRPTLNLNFNKVQKVPPFINVTRNSQTTYVDKFGILRTADINQPVFEWDPTTGKFLGARIWGSVTNLGTRSQEFDHANWAKSAASVNSNVIVAPDGTLTADALVDTTANSGHSISQSFSVTGSTAYTIAVWMKKGTKDFGAINFSPTTAWGLGTQNSRVYFNLLNGTATATGQAAGQAVAYPNGWYRCIATCTTIASPPAISAQIYPAQSSSTIVYAGNADEAIYVWGYQPSLGSAAGPYVPTTSSSVTAAADVWTITGQNFSRFYNQTEGTILVQYNSYHQVFGYNNSIFTIGTSSTSDDNLIEGFIGNGRAPVIRVNKDSVNNAYITSNLDLRTSHKIAFGYKFNDCTRSIDSQSLSTVETVDIPSNFTQLEIGSRNFGGVQPLNGHIKNILYWPKRLSNSQLKLLTA